MNLPSSSVWKTLEKEPYVYVLFDKTLVFIEPDEESSMVRMFINPTEAKNYRSEVVEHYNLRPSSLTVGRISLDDIFALKDELITLAAALFGQSLKIVLAEMVETVIVSEEEVYNSEATIH